MVDGDLKAATRDWLQKMRPYRRDKREAQYTFLPHDSALLVIDMQQFFLDEESHAWIPRGREVLGNIAKIVDRFREMDRPVIYTRHAYLDDEPLGVMERWWNDNIREGDPLSEISPDIKPAMGDVVLRKTRYNAFIGTGLENILRSGGIQRLLITGVMTHLCCESTARDAFMRDFDVYFVVDGTASSDDDLHLSSLRTLTDGFAIPVTTEEVLAWKSE
jgi:bifunctional isochorismate lyase/aryl carrier protein